MLQTVYVDKQYPLERVYALKLKKGVFGDSTVPHWFKNLCEEGDGHYRLEPGTRELRDRYVKICTVPWDAWLIRRVPTGDRSLPVGYWYFHEAGFLTWYRPTIEVEGTA